MPGVFFTEGMRLRIPALTFRIGEDGSPSMDAIIPEVALDMWPYWLDTAIDQAARSKAARAQLGREIQSAAGRPLDANLQSSLLVEECMAGMIGISAAAFALDNFYSVARDFAPGLGPLERQWASAHTARHKRVSETIRRCCRTTNQGAKVLHETIEVIFRFRDWAVHPPAEFREPITHDLLDVGVEWRFINFRAGNAARAAVGATGVIAQCLAAPRKSKELEEWARGHEQRAADRWDKAKKAFAAEMLELEQTPPHAPSE